MKCVGRMREVDHDRKGAPRHHLESAGNLRYAGEPLGHGLERHTGDRTHTGRRQTVFDIKSADERQVDVDLARCASHRTSHAKSGSERTGLDHLRT